jgi:hypothetical protein
MIHVSLMRSVGCGVCAALVLALAGCGSSGPQEPPPTVVSGTVLLDGKPVPKGSITFAANGSQTLEITDGKFEGKVTPGEKRVEVRAFQGKTEPPPGHQKGMPFEAEPKNILPARYTGFNTPLKATVSPSGELTPNKFEVQSK